MVKKILMSLLLIFCVIGGVVSIKVYYLNTERLEAIKILDEQQEHSNPLEIRCKRSQLSLWNYLQFRYFKGGNLFFAIYTDGDVFSGYSPDIEDSIVYWDIFLAKDLGSFTHIPHGTIDDELDVAIEKGLITKREAELCKKVRIEASLLRKLSKEERNEREKTHKRLIKEIQAYNDTAK